MTVTELKSRFERLATVKIHIDQAGRIHALIEGAATWKFVPPLAAGDFVKTYTELVDEPRTGLTSLTIQMDAAGRIHSRSNTDAGAVAGI